MRIPKKLTVQLLFLPGQRARSSTRSTGIWITVSSETRVLSLTVQTNSVARVTRVRAVAHQSAPRASLLCLQRMKIGRIRKRKAKLRLKCQRLAVKLACLDLSSTPQTQSSRPRTRIWTKTICSRDGVRQTTSRRKMKVQERAETRYDEMLDLQLIFLLTNLTRPLKNVKWRRIITFLVRTSIAIWSKTRRWLLTPRDPVVETKIKITHQLVVSPRVSSKDPQNWRWMATLIRDRASQATPKIDPQGQKKRSRKSLDFCSRRKETRVALKVVSHSVDFLQKVPFLCLTCKTKLSNMIRKSKKSENKVKVKEKESKARITWKMMKYLNSPPKRKSK